jgi:nucleoside-diphosphate-sugar epimerase
MKAWSEFSMPIRDNRETVYVSGAGGFIGGRVAEVLHCEGIATVRAGLRTWGSAARIARFPMQIVQCDITKLEDVESTLQGVAAVVHCAHGSADVNIDGTRNLLECAIRHGIGRFVYLSTAAVYGDVAGDVSEEQACQQAGDAYGDTKIEAEKLCHEYGSKGLAVCILRPTIVYGPFSTSWTVEPAMRLRAGRWLIPQQYARGLCNLVYVDDLVGAVLLALRRDEAVGETFNINGPDRLTWEEYFNALNDAMGLAPIPAPSVLKSRLTASAMLPVRTVAKFLLQRFQQPIMAMYQRYSTAKTVMRQAERLIRTTPTPAEFRMYGRDAFFVSEKAGRLLGYRPAFPLRDGVDLSAAWLRHHGLA